MTDQARTVAFHVLRAVSERDAYVNLLLPTLLTDHSIVGRDAAFATELTHGSIRWQGSYDAIIDAVARGGVRALDPAVLDALRLGTHQLLNMRVPAHAAVSTTGNLVRREIGHKPVGFVNAVLRKISVRTFEQWLDTVTRGRSRSEALAIRYSHPRWIVEAFVEASPDPAQIEQLLEANNTAPRVTLVARPGLVAPSELPGENGRWSPYARILEGGDPADIAAVRDGRAGVQDEGSQLVVIELTEATIEGYDTHWLDLCAGPGGKAALWGALAGQRGASVVANELQHHRAELVRKSVRALSTVSVTEFDGREGPWDEGSFDRILVDAPCSGLGALRRRPESRWRRTPEDVADLVALQDSLVDRAVDLVRPGGIVGYATCSPVRAETTSVIERLSARRDDVTVRSMQQWWPHQHDTDAMFLAILERR